MVCINTELAWDPIVRAAALGQLDRGEDARTAVAELEARFPDAAADPAHYVRGYIFAEELVGEVVDGLRKAGCPIAKPPARPGPK